MDANTVIAELISTANTITGFAVLQNITFSYLLLKREANLRIEGTYQWMMVVAGTAWNGTYVWLIWWCSFTALEISMQSGAALSPEITEAFELLTYGKCAAAALFGLCPIWLIAIYNYKPFWPS